MRLAHCATNGSNQKFKEITLMQKHFVLMLITASLLLAACAGAAPQATPIPAAPAATATAPATEEAAEAAQSRPARQ